MPRKPKESAPDPTLDPKKSDWYPSLVKQREITRRSSEALEESWKYYRSIAPASVVVLMDARIKVLREAHQCDKILAKLGARLDAGSAVPEKEACRRTVRRGRHAVRTGSLLDDLDRVLP
jgi:hypothetical protein